MTYETENAEVRRLWEASGRKARVQYKAETGCWCLCFPPPLWVALYPYRIHPDDLHMCHPVMAEAFRQREEQYAKMSPATQNTIDKLVTGSDKPAHDPVNNPAHCTSHPSGVECIQITEHMGFCLGNAMKCIWRAGLKGDEIEDLKKAAWYISREIGRRERQAIKGKEVKP